MASRDRVIHTDGLNTSIRLAAGHGFDLVCALNSSDVIDSSLHMLDEFRRAQVELDNGIVSAAEPSAILSRYTTWAFVYMDTGNFSVAGRGSTTPMHLWMDWLLTEFEIPLMTTKTEYLKKNLPQRACT